jgi:hypothetical protein
MDDGAISVSISAKITASIDETTMFFSFRPKSSGLLISICTISSFSCGERPDQTEASSLPVACFSLLFFMTINSWSRKFIEFFRLGDYIVSMDIDFIAIYTWISALPVFMQVFFGIVTAAIAWYLFQWLLALIITVVALISSPNPE